MGKRGPKPTYTEATLATIRRMAGTARADAIGEATGHTGKKIIGLASMIGVSLRIDKASPSLLAQLRTEGLSDRDIASRTGLCVQTVCYKRRAAGVAGLSLSEIGRISKVKSAKTIACAHCQEDFEATTPFKPCCPSCAKWRRRARKRHQDYIRGARRRGSVGPFHTDAEWRRRLASFGGLCAYCRSSRAEHRDHVQPIASGGAETIDNIFPACSDCNLRKGKMTLDEWRVRFREIHGRDCAA